LHFQRSSPSAQGGCCSTDNTPDIPYVLLPDPEYGVSCEFMIEKCGWSGTSRDYQAYRTHGKAAEENRWLFLNKSGSKWGGMCKIALENFVRTNPEKPKQGQVLWEADFVDSPFFQQFLRTNEHNAFDLMRHQVNEMCENNFMGGFMGGGHDHRRWGDDSFYLQNGGGWDRDYGEQPPCSLRAIVIIRPVAAMSTRRCSSISTHHPSPTHPFSSLPHNHDPGHEVDE
jgi:hypothetical protein